MKFTMFTEELFKKKSTLKKVKKEEWLELFTQISFTLFKANTHYNPHSLSLDRRSQLILSEIYDRHIKETGAFLKPVEVPSHVQAAEEKYKIHLIKIQKGTILYQYTRPEWWVGEYYADDEKYTPEELGFSNIVDIPDPKDASKNIERERVKLKFITKTDTEIDAARTQAKECIDTWSRKTEKIRCPGGGKQIYMPLTTAMKGELLAIVLPDDPVEADEAMKIAKKNNITTIMSSELKQYPSRKIQDIKIEASSTEELIEIIETCLKQNNYQRLISALEELLQIEKNNPKLISGTKYILCCLYSSLGRFEESKSIYEDIIDDKINELDVLTRIHLAKNNPYSKQAIQNLKDILENENLDENLKTQIRYELAILYNRQALIHSNSIDFHDFNQNGEIDSYKYASPNTALKFLQKIITSKTLDTNERIIALIELGYAIIRSRNNELFDDAIDALVKAEELLLQEINESNEKTHLQQQELNLQLLSAQLGIGLCCVKFKNNKNTIKLRSPIPPHSPDNIYTPVAYLEEVSKELDKLAPMQTTLIFDRWIGQNPDNLFIDGWHQNNPKNPKEGMDLIELYRKYIPLDIDTCIRDLEENNITELHLGYLGLQPPIGISKNKFIEFCEALSKNTSLQHLFLKKFSVGEIRNPGQSKDRIVILFNSLKEAEIKGQKLTYLSYANARFENPEDIEACLDYLHNNNSLKILQPSLYDWQKPEEIEKIANVIENHPTLVTLLTDIVRCENGADLLINACKNCKTFKNLIPYAKELDPIADQGAKYDNQDKFIKFSQEIGDAPQNSSLKL